jgi:diadenylate cyclase
MGNYSYFISFFEILLLAIILNYLLSFFWKTKSINLVWSIIIFVLLFAITSSLKLPILHKIMEVMGNVAVIALLIIFQPELRVALSKFHIRSKRSRQIPEFDKFLDQLSSSVYKMAEKRHGALIAIENEDSLEEYIQRSVILNADFTAELLETIFCDKTPLHDGAVILRGRTLAAASVILPLADDSSQLVKSMGTRHRAGLGLSNTTDALLIIVSEESGKISIAREGIMTRGVKIDRFKGILRSILNPPVFPHKFYFREWVKQ